MISILGYRPIELAVTGFASASAVVGLYIAWQAYRGLTEYDSRRMLYLSVGMVLLFGVAYAVGLIGTLLLQFRILPLPYQDPFRLTIRAIQFVGLLSIAYSLHLRD